MKKRMFLVAGAVLLATAVSVLVYVKNDNSSMDGLFNANVEALASGESGAGCSGPKQATVIGGLIVCRCRNTVPCMDSYGCN